MPDPAPPTQSIAATIDRIVRESRVGLSGGAISDGIWLVSVIGQLIDVARTLPNMTGEERHAEVVAGVEYLNRLVPVLARTTWDERAVEVLYQLGRMIGR